MQKRNVILSSVKGLSAGILLLAAITATTPQSLEASCTAPPTGMVSWWPAEGNANDIVGTNNGVAQNITYAGGEVGSAFYLNGSNAYVRVPASASLNVGTGSGFTFEAWINPTTLNRQALAEWNNNAGDAGIGTHLFITESQYPTLGAAPPGCIYANLIDTSGGSHVFSTGGGVVVSNSYQHIALTYDQASGLAVLYLNGNLVQSANLGSFTPQTSYDFYLGERVSGTDAGSYFGGGMDEPSLYNRALSAIEIAAIYNAGSAGKCAPAVASCVTPPSGLVGWWKGDGNTLDSFGGNNGVNQNVTYSNGVVGQAFAFDPENYSYGTYTGIQIADQPAFALTNSLTIEGWVRPRGNGYIIFWRGDNRPGTDPYVVSMDDNNTVQFQISDANGNGAAVGTTLAYNQWCHLAATLDGSSGTMSIYTNGVLASQTSTTIRPFGQLIPGDSPGVGIGNLNDGQNNFPFTGDIDEISLYGRALAAGEIQAIYNAGSAGKCTATSSAVPAISSFAPASGTNGTVVTISGTNFSATASADIVYFGAVRANVLTASPTSLTATVPVGATYAPITVTVNGLIAYASAPFLVTFAGGGSAAFAPRLDLPSPDGSGFTAIADLDGDGKPDLLVLGGSVLSIYQNLGTSGTVTTNSFAARVDLPLPAGMDAMTVADVDGDGKLDVVLLNNSSNQVMILKNISSPGILTTNSFAAPVVFPTGNDPRGLAVRDLDGDGRPELIVGNWADSTVSIFHNTGAGGITTNTFAPAVTFATGPNPQGLAVADLDGDGQPDIVTADSANFSGDGSRSVSVLRNLSTLGNIAFATNVDYPGLPASYHLAIGDLDGDGKLDLVVSSFNLGQSVSVYRNLGTPGSITTNSFAPHVDFSVGGWGNDVAIGDLDGDGKPDLAVVTQLPDHLSIFKNISTPGGFTTNSLAPRVDYPTGSNPNGIAIGDLDGDGLPDIAFAASYAATLSIYQNVTPMTVTPPNTNPPVILSQTPNQVVLLGNTATFSVNASGGTPLSYFWSRNGVLISGATNASYSLFNAQLTDSGSQFSCFVTNAYGSAGSTNVSLKVIDSTVVNDLCSGAIVITSGNYTNVQSTVQATSFGDPVPDCVDGFGHGVWYQFTAPVTGRLIVDTFGSDFDTGLAIYTGSCDALTQLQCSDDVIGVGVTSQVTIPTTAGTTYFILAGGYDSDAGNLVLHLNHLTPPAFAVQPASESVVISNTASFSATLTGALPMSFQWSFNGTPLVDDGIHIAGSATANLSISNITTADAGSYTLAVTNFLGSTNSAAAVLNVLTPPVFASQPVGRSVPPGLPTIFTAAATGNPLPSYYQWQLNGTNIPGATNSSYTNPAVGTNDLGFYQVIASNSVASAVSTSAQLTFGPVAAWGLNSSGECLPPPGLSNVVAVAGNRGASFAVRADGAIIPWGSGSVTNIPASASNIVAISTSDGSPDFALRSDGTVVGWPNYAAPVLSNIVSIASGYGFAYGLRAEGTLTNFYIGKNVPLPAGLNHITAIACGYSSALALRSDGTVVIAGSGTGGVTYGPDGVVNPPAGLNNVVAIAAGYTYAMVLKSNGTVVAWGSGTGTNLPPGLTNIVAISAGNYFGENSGMAIRSDGTLLTWGDNNYGDKTPPSALSNLVSIAAAAPAFHGLALVNNGGPVILHPPVGLTAYTGRSVTLQGSAVGAQPLSYQWLLNGTNISGATNTSLVLPNVQFGSAGNYQLFVSNSISTALSLPAPLTVVSNSALTFLSVPAGQTNYQGSKVTLGVTVLGSGPVSYQWYYSTNIQGIFTAVPGANSDSLVFDPALAGQSGYYRVVASNQFNSVTSPSTYERVLFAKAWGYLPADPPFNVTNATAIAVGNLGTGNAYGHYLVLKSDGTISSWIGALQYPQYGQTNFAALSNSIVTAIAAGYGDSLALKSDGTVYATGFGIYGETNVPTGLSGVTAIACGDYHDLALKFDGTIVGWGQNTYGQATNVAYSYPYNYGYIPVTNVVALAAGANNSIALHADGSVVTWGQYGNGQYTIPFNATNVIAVAAGGTHFLALRANGTVVGWGYNSYGQATIPATWSNIVAISAGGNHSVALRNDGTILTLGNYYNGPTLNPGSVPSDLANVIAIASSGDHDLGLFGTRAPAFTVHPWDRAIDLTARTNITLAAKCAGVQPVYYQWKLNGTNVPGATNDTLILTNNPSLQYGPIRNLPTGAYQLIASNAYGVATSQYAKITTFIPLAVALNTPTDGKGNYLYNWTTSGNAQWFGETNVTHDGVSAAQSGGIGPFQQTILQTTVGTNWPGSYTFWWNVSSEQDFDFLEFRINGIVQTSISGSPGWQQVSIPVAAGTNTLMWRYYKDPTIDVGLDAGWVDQFAYIPAPPFITQQPLSQTAWMGTSATFQANAAWRGIAYVQWLKNGTNLPNAHSLALTLSNLSRQDSGIYALQITNVDGSAVSSNAVLKVLVPQLLATPQLLPNGTFQLLSTDANGGLLSPSDLPNFAAQASTDLVNWVTLPNALSLTNGMLLLQDSGSSNYTTRYYRIIEQ